MKPHEILIDAGQYLPAAFGRLCVETANEFGFDLIQCQPPSGGCVLKLTKSASASSSVGPAAFGRLCVETKQAKIALTVRKPSRLRAAVC